MSGWPGFNPAIGGAPRGGNDDGVMALAICWSGVAYTLQPYQDEASPIEFLLSELAHLPVSDAAKSEFMGLLRRMAGQRVQLKKALILTPYRIRIAANMLNNGNRAPAVRESIMRSAGISRATSYRIIGKALNHRR